MNHIPDDREHIFLWPGEAPHTKESGGQAQPSIKLFRVEGSKGAMIVCPGGGYVMKAAHEGDPVAEMLNRAGISAYVLDYRVKPCPLEAPLGDAKRAIRLVRSMGYEKVGILGFSAGGHLSCSAATLYDLGDPDSDDPIERVSCKPDAFVPCYAVVSFRLIEQDDLLKALLSEPVDLKAIIRRFSIELNINEHTPPAFIWHTANDDVVAAEHSLLLAATLSDAKVPYELHIYPEGAHGLGLAEGIPPVEGWAQLCCNWLLKLGFGF